MRVLIVEDDKDVAVFIHNNLVKSGHVADVTHDGAEGLALASANEYDVLILDRMLPKLDGVSIVSTLRKQGIETPALFLSALDKVNERVVGLRAGADDYLTKPFAFEELLARLDVLCARVRSKASSANTQLKVKDLSLDLLARKVKRGEREIALQSREFKLLEFLMRHQDQIITRTMLLEKVWDYNFDPQTNIIDVHISRLRQKIDKGFPEPIIETVRGAGYLVASH